MTDIVERYAEEERQFQARRQNGKPHNSKPRGEQPERNSASGRIPWRPFPIGQLPAVLSNYCKRVAASLGTDCTFVVLPALAAMASAIGRTARVQVRPRWYEPPILWTATVGESGAGKTPGFKTAIEPLWELERERMEQHGLPEVDFDDEGDSSETPNPGRLTVVDATTESLAPILQENPCGLLMADDELSGFFMRLNEYKRGGADRSRWLIAYDCGRMVIDRKTGKERHIAIPKTSISVCGTVQPGVLQRVLTAEDVASGLPARFVFACPPDAPLGWTDTDLPDPWPYQELLRRLLSRRDELGPTVEQIIPLDDEAVGIAAAMKDEDKTRLAGISGALRSAWSKSLGRAARLALIIELAKDPRAPQVTGDSMASAAIISRWFDSEAERLYSILGLASSPDAELLAFIRDVQQVTCRDVQTWKRSRYPTASAAETALMRLAAEGLLSRSVHHPEGPGRPTETYRIVADTQHTNS